MTELPCLPFPSQCGPRGHGSPLALPPLPPQGARSEQRTGPAGAAPRDSRPRPPHPTCGLGGEAERGLQKPEHPGGSVLAIDVAARYCETPNSPICVLPPKRENSLHRHSLIWQANSNPRWQPQAAFPSKQLWNQKLFCLRYAEKGTSQQLGLWAVPIARGPQRSQEPGLAKEASCWRRPPPTHGHTRHKADGNHPPRCEGSTS